MILVDTNVVSEAMREGGDARVIDWIDAQDIDTLYLSAITVAELRFGVAILPSGARRERLSARLEQEALPLFAGRVLPFDVDASATYASLMAKAKVAGRAIGKADGYIAAIAAVHGLVVATRDAGPFESAGLKVIDPWTHRP
jgi:predicted nucleic acid-binding protein